MATSQLGASSPQNTIRSSLAPPSNTARAALLAQERVLIEKIRFMGEAWNRHRVKIELELGDVRRKLERLASSTWRHGARSPERMRSETRKVAPPKGAPTPPVSRVSLPEARKKHQPTPRSSLVRLFDRLVAMCVVETTAASYSGMRSWKTKPCRVLLRLFAKPGVPVTR